LNQDARRASKIETNDISVLLGEGRQKSEHVSLPKLIIESAKYSPLGPGDDIAIRDLTSLASFDARRA
jgi:hypothetical protein